jgi:hypothetical protein
MHTNGLLWPLIPHESPLLIASTNVLTGEEFINDLMEEMDTSCGMLAEKWWARV